MGENKKKLIRRTGSITTPPDWHALTALSRAAEDWGEDAMFETLILMERAEEQNLQMAKARQLSRREARRPGVYVSGAYLRSKLVDLLDYLYRIGAFKDGLPYNKAVDGVDGRLTQAAIAKAKKMGYTYDPLSQTLSKEFFEVQQPEDKTGHANSANSDLAQTERSFVPKVRADKVLSAFGLPGLGLATAVYNYEPISFYVNDLLKGAKNKLHLDTKSTTRTEKDMSDSFNNQIQELAAMAIASGLDDLDPWVYKVYNTSHGEEAKYADFDNFLKFFNPKHRAEYSDGGMSMSKSRTKNGYDVVLTDEAAWDPDINKETGKPKEYSIFSPRGLPVALGVTKKNLGDNTDKMRYLYSIPFEKVDSMRNVYNKYSEIARKEIEERLRKEREELKRKEREGLRIVWPWNE